MRLEISWFFCLCDSRHFCLCRIRPFWMEESLGTLAESHRRDETPRLLAF